MSSKKKKKTLSKKASKRKPALKRVYKSRQIKKTQKPTQKRKQPTRSKPIKLTRDQKRFIKDQGISEKEFIRQSKRLQKQIKREEKLLIKGHRKTGKGKGKETHEYFLSNSLESIQKTFPHAHSIKSFPSRSQAVNWWISIAAGMGYFMIAKSKSPKGQTLFHIVETRTQKELSNKGNLGGTSRMSEIMGMSDDELEDDF